MEKKSDCIGHSTVCRNCLIVLVFCSLWANVWAGGFSDNHGSNTFAKWNQVGPRDWDWSEDSNGDGFISTSGSNQRGFLIRNYDCANDGVFTARIRCVNTEYQTYSGGMVFRYQDSTKFYYLAYRESNDEIKVFKDTIPENWNVRSIATFGSRTLSSQETISVKLEDSTFTVYLDGYSIGTVTDSDHSSGRVGYGYRALNNQWVEFLSSSWQDATAERVKANNTTALNLASSWVGGVVPAIGDTAVWDDTVTSANAVSMGANAHWNRLKILDPGGDVTINNNTLTLGAGGIDMSSATRDLTVNSAVVLDAGQSWTIASGRTLSSSGIVSGTGNLTKTGAGTLTLEGDNTFTGDLSFAPGTGDQGVIRISNNDALGSGPKNITMPGQTTSRQILELENDVEISDVTIRTAGRRDSPVFLRNVSGNNIWHGDIKITDHGGNHLIESQDGNLTLTGTLQSDIINTRRFKFSGSGNGTVSGTITDGKSEWLGVIKEGSGTWTFSGDNTYTGGTTINGGFLEVNSNNAVGTDTVHIRSGAKRLILGNGVVLNNDIVINNGVSPDAGWGAISLGTNSTLEGTVTIDDSTTSGGHFKGNSGASIKGAITSSVPVVFRRGDIRLSGGGSYERIVYGNGTLSLDAENGISPLAELHLRTDWGTTIFDLNNYNQALTGLSTHAPGADTVTNSSTSTRTLTINNSSEYNYGGAITGNLSLVKSGSATFTLSGTGNIYSGATMVSQGALSLTGSLGASAVTVDSGAVFQGTGTAAGVVTIQNNATIAPGVDGAGTLSTGGLNLNESSILDFDLGAASGTIVVTDTLLLNGVLNISQGDGFGVGRYTLFSFETITDNGLDIGSTPDGYCYEIEISGNEVVLIVSAMAEPGEITGGKEYISIGQSTGEMILEGHDGDIDQWQSRVDGAAEWTTIAHSDSIYSPTPSSVGEWQYRVVTTIGSCTQYSSTFTVNVVALPDAPVSEGEVTVCGPGEVTVAVEEVDGIAVDWYAVDSGGEILENGEGTGRFVTTIDTCTVFYAQARDTLTGGVSETRTAVMVTISSTPPPTGDLEQVFDPLDYYTVADLSAAGQDIQWYAAATGGDALDPAAPLKIGFYYATQTVEGCESIERLEVLVSTGGDIHILTYLAGEGGSIEGDSVQVVELQGSGTEVVAVADSGYRFIEWSDGVKDASRREEGVTADTTVTAEFAPLEFRTLTYRAGEGGSIDGDTVQVVELEGSGTEVTAVADEGYIFTEWSDGVKDASRREESVRADTTVTAEFAPLEYTLTYTAGDNGSIDGESPQTVTHGGSGDTVLAVPDSGYEFIGWNDGLSDTLHTDNPRVDKDVTGDISVTALFAMRPDPLSSVEVAVLGPFSVRLSWEEKAGGYGDSIIVVVQKVGETETDTVVVSKDKNEVVIDGLKSSSSYEFKVIVVENNLYSDPEKGFGETPDIVKIDSVFFVDSIFGLGGYFTINDEEMQSDEYRYLRVATTSDTVAYPASSFPANTQENYFEIPNISDTLLVFDTTLYLHLWIERDGERMPPVAPYKVMVGSFKTQPVFFRRNQPRPAYANNRMVILDSFTSDFNDKINMVEFEQTAGFIPAGIGYEFENGTHTSEFSIGFKAQEIGSDYSIDDVRIYRWIESVGRWMVMHNGEIDKENGVVTARVNLTKSPFYNAPFKLMIDTTDFEVDYSDAYEEVEVKAASAVTDTFTVRAAIANASMTIRYIRENELVEMDTTLFKVDTDGSGEQTVMVTIPADASEEYHGIVAFLEVSNGRSSELINISRSVAFDSYSARTDRLRWRPLFAKTALEDDAMLAALASLSGDSDKSLRYDNSRFRVFRWYEHKGNRNASDKWVEYNKAAAGTDFNLEPGRVLWIKTDQNRSLDLGASRSINTRESWRLIIPPKQWADFGLPYNFDVKVGDIIDATSGSDGLEMYEWRSLNRTYSAALFYSHNNPVDSLSDLERELKGGARDAYTVYNSSKDTVEMVIPAIPAVMSDVVSGALKKSGLQSWYLVLHALSSDSSTLNPVMLGYGASKRTFMAPPSMNTAQVTVIEGAEGRSYGHLFTPDLQNGGSQFRLRFSNRGSSRETIQWGMELSSNFPDSLEMVVVDPRNGAIKKQNQLTLEANSSQERILVVGTSSYMEREGFTEDKLRFSLESVGGLNRGAVPIRYFMPVVGVNSVELSLVDIRGRLVWSREHSGTPNQWHTILWDGKNRYGRGVSAGTYILRVKTMDNRGKPTQVIDRRVLYIP